MAEREQTNDVESEQIIALERAALNRWGRGDPQGYLEIMGPDVSYFDPFQEQRIDGLGAMTSLLTPFTGAFTIDRYELVRPRIQRDGNIAVLTFNLVNYSRQADGSESVLNRWNATEVYQRVEGAWKLVHEHWSYTRPQLSASSTS